MKLTKFRMTMRRFFIVSFLFILAAPLFLSAGGRGTTVIDKAVLDAVAGEVSGETCMEHILRLSAWHRIWGSRDYHQAAQYLVDKAAAYGLENAVIESFPVKTGKELFWMHGVGGVPSYDLRRAEIRLIRPFHQMLAHSDSIPSAVSEGSRTTDTKAEIVFVGAGHAEACYEGKDVRGKIVLAEGGSARDVHELAVHGHGALGTMIFPDKLAKYGNPESVYWSRIMPWSSDGKKPSTFGINLSVRQGLLLKNMIEKGETPVMSVKIDAEIVADGGYELATAVIPGSWKPEEEFIFYAHLDHPKPGAHDNASGGGVLLEIARTLSSLIREGVIPRPLRTIRFMWIPHMMGLNMYFSRHEDKIGKVRGGCNIDCVGVDPAKFPSMFHLSLPPHSLPTPLADITQALAEHVNEEIASGREMLYAPGGSRNQFSVTIRPYMGYSDEYTANTRSLNMPSILFDDTPIPYPHSQTNVPDFLDATQLRRVAFLGSVISYSFASIGENSAPTLLDEIRYRARVRMDRELLLAKERLNGSDSDSVHLDYGSGLRLLAWGLRREMGTADSLAALTGEAGNAKSPCAEYGKWLQNEGRACRSDLMEAYKTRCRELGAKPTGAANPSRPPVGSAIPVLNPKIKGSPGYARGYFERELGEDYLKKYPLVNPRFNYGKIGYYETLAFVDGRNTITDIYDAVEAELWSGGYDAAHHLTFEETVEYIRMLKDAHVLDILAHGSL